MITALLEPKDKNKRLEGKKPRTVFEAIERFGDDANFAPLVTPKARQLFVSTSAAPGSDEKIEVLRRRIELGLPLWHRDDRTDFSGIKLHKPSSSEDTSNTPPTGFAAQDCSVEASACEEATNYEQTDSIQQDCSIDALDQSDAAVSVIESASMRLGRGNAHSQAYSEARRSGEMTEVEERARAALEQKLRRKREALKPNTGRVVHSRKPTSAGQGGISKAQASPPVQAVHRQPELIKNGLIPTSSMQSDVVAQSSPAQQPSPSTEALAELQVPQSAPPTFTQKQREVLRILESLETAVRNNWVTDSALEEFKREHHELLSQLEATQMCP